MDYEIFGDDMQIVEVELDPNETVIGEAGAMNYLEEEISFESKMGDGTKPDEGLMGETAWRGEACSHGGIDLHDAFHARGSHRQTSRGVCGPISGKIIPVDLASVGGELLCQKDAFLCAALGTEVSIAFNKRIGAGFLVARALFSSACEATDGLHSCRWHGGPA